MRCTSKRVSVSQLSLKMADLWLELTRAADVAMKAHPAGKRVGYLFFSPSMNIQTQEPMATESELRQALSEGSLCLHYQQGQLRNGRIVGAEALILAAPRAA